MTGTDQRDRKDSDVDGRRSDLDGRLSELKRRVEARKPTREAEKAAETSARGYAQAMKLSSEFIAGIVVGGVLGWGIDEIFGTLPFGLIVFLLLGFAAGVLNVLRAVGRVAEPEYANRREGKSDDPAP